METNLKIKTQHISTCLLFLILITNFIMVLSSFTHGHGWGDDFASYILQAKSILSRSTADFYQRNSYTILNSSIILGPVAYPWGYPLILSPVYAVFGLNRIALKLPNAIFFILFLVIFDRLLKKRISDAGRILIIAILAFNPYFLSFQNQVLSDIPFLFFSTFSIFLIDLFYFSQNRMKNVLIKYIILGFSIFFSTFVRTIGITLLPTLLVIQFFFVRKNWNQERNKISQILIQSIPYLSFIFFWIISSLIFPKGESSYLLSISSKDLFGIFKGNLLYYFFLISEILPFGLWNLNFYSMLLLFMVVGLICTLRKDYLFFVFSMFQLTVALFWPTKIGPRMIFSIIPFFFYDSLIGMECCISWLKKPLQKYIQIIGSIFWIVLLILSFKESLAIVKERRMNLQKLSEPFDAISGDMFNFIRGNTPEDSIIVFFKPRAMHLMTDRNAVAIDNCSDLSKGNFLVMIHQNYNGQISQNNLDTCGIEKKLVYDNREFSVYELIK